MSNKDTGGQAFPHYPSANYEAGMTLRDYFAAKAMQGYISIPETGEAIRQNLISARQIAGGCYEWADAMLKEREK